MNASWLALNAKSPGERSIRMAMIIMSANTAGIIGSQLFQARDAPKYHTGWAAIVGVIATGFVLSLVANVQYWYLNRKLDREEANKNTTEASVPESAHADVITADLGNGAVVEKFRYKP